MDWTGWLAGGRTIDLQAGVASAPVAIRIESGRVAEVASAAPDGAGDVVDCHGLFLLPGITTCHVHLQATYPYSVRDPNEPPARTALRAAAHAERLLVAGITTIRTVHEQAQADLHVREAAAQGWVQAPRIIAGGRALTIPGGHGDGLGAVVASGPDGFYRAARAELEAGAEHVKIFASGGLARAGESLDRPEMSREEMAGAVQAAGERGTYVVAHVASSVVVRLGLEAGVRSFEHAYSLDAVAAAEMADAGAYLTPTLVVTHAVDWMERAGFDAAARDRSSRMAGTHAASAAAAIGAGVRILHGTDFPPAAASDGTTIAVRELELLVEAGLAPVDALRAVTRTPAALLGLGPASWTIASGALADIVAVDADPLQSVSALRHLRVLVRRGRLVAPPGARD